ncbi:tetratricopeptide repeat protein [Pseudoduganella buxea]|uniref:Tetratricopeptide repeat protein n=1 Tax=Pseudoduganella buxea TaxID=1949069 RepID=A0A6I3SYS3_9BURK|nr:tetratricopeptide repeat protein [Pseudoduganella buxea]MTV54398.1 tetratricopeptide repeat protein [Pseudoduganella buxea]GGC10934.1 hypothetical protein GCM10011572_35340 [Pseudoduganella buxea]
MSLLMQALKKAERLHHDGLPPEEADKADGLALEPLLPPAAAAPASSVPPPGAESPATGTELGLEPLERADRPAAPPPAPSEPQIPLVPAVEAAYDPVPPQARHELPGTRKDGAQLPPASPGVAKSEDTAHAEPGVEALARPGRPGASYARPPNPNLPRLRIAALGGILLIIVAAFAYVYWKATSAPGPGAALPMVPMPPPSATGATGIVVAPVDQPFGQAANAQDAAAGELGQRRGDEGMASYAQPPVQDRAALQAGVQAAPPVQVTDPEAQRAEAEYMARQQMAEPARNSEASVARPAAAPPDSGDVHIVRSNGAAINPVVQNAYAAFTAGDYATARNHYDIALRQDPNNRDALLGSAAVALRDNRGEQAAAVYARLLQLNPNDPDALAALVSMRGGDATRAESRLNDVLKTQPEAAPVLFALGNLYARQGRWPEAQQSYFRAYTAAPGNPDYAFNLAVGLDRLNQGRLAITYYQKALALNGTAGFDRAAVQRRLQELQAAVRPGAGVATVGSAPATSAAVPAPGDN